MNILIAGASGLIGNKIMTGLTSKGHNISALSRSPHTQQNIPNVKWRLWKENDYSDWKEELAGADIIINLVGESIAGKRWTAKRKSILLSSRVDACKLFIKAIKETEARPALFIQVSAIGIYTPGQENISEKSDTGGSYLADLAVKWEQSLNELESLNIPRIILRVGLVISREALLIKKFLLPFKLFIGGPVGNGKQMMSWIHIDDLGKSILHIIGFAKKSAVFNLTAPNPVSMKDFCRAFGKVINRPSWLYVPGFMLKFIFGREMASETMLSGERVLPVNLLENGYEFNYTDIKEALSSIF